MDSIPTKKNGRKSVRGSSAPAIAIEFPVESDGLLDMLSDSVAQDWKVVVEAGSNYDLRYFDTFDWRVYRAGWVMSETRRKQRRELGLAARGGDVLQRLADVGAPEFARDLPPGRLRDAVAAVTEPRRLFPLVRMKVRERIVRILNIDEKTVVRVVLQERKMNKSSGQGEPLVVPCVLRVVPVKGYWQEHAALTELLSTRLGLSAVADCAFASAMNAAGLKPGGYKSKTAVALLPQMTSEAAARAILQTLLDTMRANCDGVRRNLDPEFLHDYRVAIRGTRSLLKQVRGVFPDSVTRHFSGEFKWLGAATGQVRDLDVYLLKMADFRAQLPAETGAHLGPLDKFLHAHHTKDQRRLVRVLQNQRYRALVDEWSTFLHSPVEVDEARCPDAAKPVIELASDRIWRAFRRVRTRGRVIEENVSAEAMHALRIECKKLRYLLEFFGSLYPPREVRHLTQSLKRLQTNLGDFNDCEVQRHTLERFANEMFQEGLASADSLLAMGRLTDHLLQQQEDERQRFEASFASFLSPDNLDRYRLLFKPHRKEAQ